MARALVKTAGQTPRNLIINGNFDFWQRGTSFAALATGVYGADRFTIDRNGPNVSTISRSTDVPTQVQSGFQSTYSLLSTVTTAEASLAATSFMGHVYHVEGLDYVGIHNKSARLQFWVKNSIAGTYSVSFRNSAANRSYVSTYTVLAANTWEKKSIDLQFDSSGTWGFDTTRGVRIFFSNGAGTTFQTATLNTWQAGNFNSASTQTNGVATNGATFQIAQVMLTQGTYLQDTSLVFRRAGDVIEDEYAMCQRYYEKAYNIDDVPGTNVIPNAGRGIGSASGTTIDRIEVWFKIPKRATPSVSFWAISGTPNQWSWNDQAVGGTGTPAVSISGLNNISVSIGSLVGSPTIGRAAFIQGYWAADSEL